MASSGWSGVARTVRRYFDDTYRFALDGARVLAIVSAPSTPAATSPAESAATSDAQLWDVALDETVFHPQGGASVLFAATNIRDHDSGGGVGPLGDCSQHGRRFGRC
jgi:hypothetical protein